MPLNEIAEHGALRDLEEGDKHNALKRLMDAYGTELYRFCNSYVKSAADAEDVLQLTFMQAFEGFGEFSAASTLRSWLYSIARNRCLDRLKADRRLRARVEFVDEPPEPEPNPGDASDSAGVDEVQRILRLCIEALSALARSAVLLRFQSGFSYPEIALITQEKPKTLQVRVARALPELRRCLSKHGVSL